MDRFADREAYIADLHSRAHEYMRTQQTAHPRAPINVAPINVAPVARPHINIPPITRPAIDVPPLRQFERTIPRYTPSLSATCPDPWSVLAGLWSILSCACSLLGAAIYRGVSSVLALTETFTHLVLIIMLLVLVACLTYQVYEGLCFTARDVAERGSVAWWRLCDRWDAIRYDTALAFLADGWRRIERGSRRHPLRVAGIAFALMFARVVFQEQPADVVAREVRQFEMPYYVVLPRKEEGSNHWGRSEFGGVVVSESTGGFPDDTDDGVLVVVVATVSTTETSTSSSPTTTEASVREQSEPPTRSGSRTTTMVTSIVHAVTLPEPDPELQALAVADEEGKTRRQVGGVVWCESCGQRHCCELPEGRSHGDNAGPS